MPAKRRLTMRQLRQMLRLAGSGTSSREIAVVPGVARSTVQDNLKRAAQVGLTWPLTRDAAEVLKMFRNMVFNVYARNRDDHAKNHAFLMDENGRWSLAPAYDLTFSSGPGGEHSTAIAGEGRNPGMSHLLAVSRGASISDQDAREVIEQVRAAVDRLPEFAEEVRLSRSRTAELDKFLNGNRPAC